MGRLRRLSRRIRARSVSPCGVRTRTEALTLRCHRVLTSGARARREIGGIMRKVVQPLGTALLLALALLLAGCPKKPTTQPEAPPAQTEVPPAQAPDTSAADAAADAHPAAEQRLLAQTVIYFDFDRSDIRPEFVEVIAAHARKLAAAPNLKARLE